MIVTKSQQAFLECVARGTVAQHASSRTEKMVYWDKVSGRRFRETTVHSVQSQGLAAYELINRWHLTVEGVTVLAAIYHHQNEAQS